MIVYKNIKENKFSIKKKKIPEFIYNLLVLFLLWTFCKENIIWNLSSEIDLKIKIIWFLFAIKKEMFLCSFKGMKRKFAVIAKNQYIC